MAQSYLKKSNWEDNLNLSIRFFKSAGLYLLMLEVNVFDWKLFLKYLILEDDLKKFRFEVNLIKFKTNLFG